MSKPVCLVTAPVATRSGYGAHSRDIVRALIKLDKYEVKIWSVPWGSTPQNALDKTDENDIPIIERLLSEPKLDDQPELHIHIVIPNEFQTFGKYNIGITAGLETTACPPVWIQGMNRMNMNIVPSTFVKDVLSKVQFDIQDDKTGEKQGVLKNEKPIEVLFEGVDTNIFGNTNKFSTELVSEMDKIEEDFCFLYVGHWLQGDIGKDRKDTSMLVKVFCETFKNMKKQPALIMKTSSAGFSIIDRENMLNKINSLKEHTNGKCPNIYLVHGDFTDGEMNELYNHPKVKAHVSFTHGEGFGRPLLEASLSEKPVIASNWSGHLDFLNKNAVLLDGNMEKVQRGSFPDDFFVEGMEWFTVNYKKASDTFRKIYRSYKKYTPNAKRLANHNYKTFSLDMMTKELDILLDKYVPEFPKQVKLELPKLKKVDSKEPPKLELPKLKKV
jgi:glycosyltransferase involved in cell wall biosynthesis|tara:strand:+ start:237 stop:1562 length:1326 start_codon:yes stop_codon:yes gene_type:complete